MVKTSQLPILIIGGGIGGTVTALALARKGIPSIVLEQAADFREIGGGIQFCPNVFKMFEYLGIKQPIVNIAFFPNNLIYMDGVNGQEYARIPLGEKLVSRFNHPYGVFHRGELLSTLISECKKSPLIQLTPSAKVVSFEDTGSKVVARTQENTIFEGKALIGCDGMWSLAREYIVGKAEPRVTKSLVYRALVPLKDLPENLRPHDVVHWHRPNSHLVHYPISTSGLLNVVAEIESEKPHTSRDTTGEPSELEEMFENSPEPVMHLLKLVDKTHMRVMCDRDPIPQWSKGRVTLLGDAAHPTLPHLTQGAGMAIEDGVVLAHHLSLSKEDYETAFREYEKQRLLRTTYVQTMSRAYLDVHHATGVARELRNYVFSKTKTELIYDLFGLLYEGIELPPN